MIACEPHKINGCDTFVPLDPIWTRICQWHLISCFFIWWLYYLKTTGVFPLPDWRWCCLIQVNSSLLPQLDQTNVGSRWINTRQVVGLYFVPQSKPLARPKIIGDLLPSSKTDRNASQWDRGPQAFHSTSQDYLWDKSFGHEAPNQLLCLHLWYDWHYGRSGPPHQR